MRRLVASAGYGALEWPRKLHQPWKMRSIATGRLVDLVKHGEHDVCLLSKPHESVVTQQASNEYEFPPTTILAPAS